MGADHAALDELVRRVRGAHSMGVSGARGAVVRARRLIDVDRHEQALAVLIPEFTSGSERVHVFASYCVDRLTGPRAALAVIEGATPPRSRSSPAPKPGRRARRNRSDDRLDGVGVVGVVGQSVHRDLR